MVGVSCYIAPQRIFEDSRVVSGIVQRAVAVVDALHESPCALLEYVAKSESVLEQLQGRVSQLVECMSLLVDALPDDVSFLRAGEVVGRAVLLSESCRLPLRPCEKVRALVQCAPRKRFRDASCNTESDLTAPYIADTAVQTIEQPCRKAIDAEAESHWRAFIGLQFRRALLAFRIFTVMRRDVPHPLGHARAVMHAYAQLRDVYLRQAQLLSNVDSVAANHQSNSPQSCSGYRARLMSRMTRLATASGARLLHVHEFLSHIVGHLKLAPVDTTAVVKRRGATSIVLRQRNAEGVRRLKRRKPWLFVNSLDAGALGNPRDALAVGSPGIWGEDPAKRFNEDHPPRTLPHHPPASKLPRPQPPGFSGVAPPPPVSLRTAVDSVTRQAAVSAPSPPRTGAVVGHVSVLSPRRRIELCSECKAAKLRREQPPFCRSSTCAVSHAFGQRQRRLDLAISGS